MEAFASWVFRSSEGDFVRLNEVEELLMEVFDLFAAQGVVGGADFEAEGVARHSLVESFTLVEVDEVAFEKERMREFVELFRQSFVTRFEGPHEGEVLP